MEEIGLMQLIGIVLGSNSIVGFIVALMSHNPRSRIEYNKYIKVKQ